MTDKNELPPFFSNIDAMGDWETLIGKDDATALLTGMGDIGGSQDLLEQLAAAVLPSHHLHTGLSGAAVPTETEPLSEIERLQKAELHYRSVIDNLPCVAFIAGMGQGSSEVYINSYIEKLLGYSKEEWMRDPFLWYWRLHADDRESWNQEFARGLTTGGPWNADCRFLAADGHSVWVRGQASIIRDGLGRPLFLQGIAFDISTLKESEQRATEQLDATLAIIASLTDGLIAFKDNGVITLINTSANNFLGLKKARPATLDELCQTIDSSAAKTLLDAVSHVKRTREINNVKIEMPTGGQLILECKPLSVATQQSTGILFTIRRPSAETTIDKK